MHSAHGPRTDIITMGMPIVRLMEAIFGEISLRSCHGYTGRPPSMRVNRASLHVEVTAVADLMQGWSADWHPPAVHVIVIAATSSTV